MSAKNERLRKDELIGRVIKEAEQRLSGDKAQTIGAFIARYYDNVPPRDLLEKTQDSLFGAAFAHWKSGAKRMPGKHSLHVYNPTLEEYGWRSEHTVIEIVTDDMPFLIDSITAELNRMELTVHLVIHPLFYVTRDAKGNLKEAFGEGGGDDGAKLESFMHFEVTEQSGSRLDDIHGAVLSILMSVQNAVTDWSAMREKMVATLEELDTAPVKLSKDDLDEVRAFLNWAYENQFTFLGYREYVFKGNGKRATVSVDRSSGLGVLRDPDFVVFQELRDLASMPPAVQDFISRPDVLMVTKTNVVSPVHRPVHMEFIGVKRFDKKGKVIGQRMFVGLFTAAAYHRSAREIPLLRRKIEKTFDRAQLKLSSHDGKKLLHILETFPRDELFQVSEEYLYQTGLGILHLQERQRVVLFLRRDDFERFISCLIYIPRDHYTTDLRLRMQVILEKAFSGKVSSHFAQLGDTPLARLHVIVQTTPGKIPDYDSVEIEAMLVEEARSWADHLRDALVHAHGEETGQSLFHRYRRAFRSGYRERNKADVAVSDISKLERALETGSLTMNLYRPIEAPDDRIWFKVYNPDTAIPLSDVLPMLEHMGLRVLDEVPHVVSPAIDNGKPLMIHDFGLKAGDGGAIDLGTVRDKFQRTFERVWQGVVESDGFNALVLRAGLDWREVVMIRAYCKYLRQAGAAFSQAYMEQTLLGNPALARLTIDLFKIRFDPKMKKEAHKLAEGLRKQIDLKLDTVVSADEDRILRRFINLVEATLRTNYFQPAPGGEPKPYVSFKLDSKKVDGLPLPRPFREIFVYSPRVEGIHLRFGKVARGGLRWSDRREDFRTEILGLVKAQQVKNAVIVPVGSKGGFVVKCPPAEGGREALLEEGIACYKTLISGLLDLTDNLKGDEVVPPRDVVRLDDDDPYLVVAADKGTATFSDIANGVSADYGFWLGDAFASGGSDGYDHKKMGITARGAWESVKRHFRGLGKNIQKQDFTVVGVGDMSGDVFGNGMLLSSHIRLTGAFNHLHIFIDPNPDVERSFIERKRLFEMPRSGWQDYDLKLISKGGAIFERSAKSLKINPEIKKMLGLIKDTVTPGELIRALLCAEVELLWFGGIGTYVKASDETDIDAGDRSNDAIRINAGELRCTVIGEGANLGVTHKGRIEFALGGGLAYADSIDNSAGVDCSDHEVNIKILIDQVVDNGDLTMKQRNILLASMTDEVGDLVLRDNYLQTQAINTVKTEGISVLDSQIRLMRMLEKNGRLNREVEFLPDDETLIERAAANVGLVAPEISVLMPHSKLWVYDELLNSDLPDDSYLAEDLLRYFPTPLRKKFKEAISKHRLRREIVATRVTNSMINRVGGSFVNRMVERTGMRPEDIAGSYIVTREIFGLRSLWDSIEGLDNEVPPPAQTEMLLEINRLIEWGTLWFLRNGRRPLDITALIGEYAKGIAALSVNLEKILPVHYHDDIRNRAALAMEQGVPAKIALWVAGLVNLYSACDIVRLACSRKLDVAEVGKLYFQIGTRYRLGRMRAATERLDTQTHWQKLAAVAMTEELYGHQLALTSQVLDASGGVGRGKSVEAAIGKWEKKNNAAIERTELLLSELWATEITGLSMIAVASRQLRTLAETPQE